MNKIIVVGLGPWERGYLSVRAAEAMRSAVTVFRTAKHPEAGAAETKKTICLDALYDEAESFEELNRALADKVLELAGRFGTVVYAVPGQGLTGEGSVRELLERARGAAEIEVIPGVEESAPLAARCAARGAEAQSYAVIPAPMLGQHRPDRTRPLAVTQMDGRILAGEVKLLLSRYYGDTAEVFLATGDGVAALPLCEIDRLGAYDHRTMLWLPPHEDGAARYDLYDIVSIMDTLRSPTGCPWDREQTHESLKQYLLEETYEVHEAIDRGSMEELCEELGDVLLQVVFHARLAAERGDFDIDDVSDAVSRKMILRHPHIFGDVVADSSEQVLQNWEEIKKKEKGQTSEAGVMRQIPNALPAVIRSMKVQGKAARVGFDWKDVWGAFEKLEEEVGELREAVSEGQGQDRFNEELGDVLFAAINVARFLHVHPEFALQGTVRKFIERFDYIESRARAGGRELETMTLEEMDAFWNEAKSQK